MTIKLKIATAAMNREISQINDCDGVQNNSLRLRGCAADFFLKFHISSLNDQSCIFTPSKL